MNRMIYVVFVFCSSIIFGTTSLAQDPPIKPADVERIIQSVNDPRKKIDTLLFLSDKLSLYNFKEEAKHYCKLAVNLSEKVDSHEDLCLSYYYYGVNLFRQKDYDSSIIYLRKSLTNFPEALNFHKGRIYNTLGKDYLFKGQIDSAAQQFRLAEKANTQSAPYNNWEVYHNWYRLYVNAGDYESAEQYLVKAYKITRQKMSPMHHGFILFFLRQLATKKDDMEAYARYTKEYYEMNRQAGNHKEVYAHGFDLEEGKSVEEQIETYEQLIQENNLIDFKKENYILHKRLAELYLSKKKAQAAITHLQQIDTSKLALIFLIDKERLFAQAYEMSAQYKLANEHWKRLLQLESNQYKKERSFQLLELEKKYQAAEKEKALAVAELARESQEAELLRTRKQRNMYIGAAVFLLLFLGSIGYLSIQNRKKNKLLQQQNKRISKSLEEKEVLLREIHHRVKNNLQVISSLLSLQSNYISDDLALKAIQEGKNRVASMALIHQNLYREDSPTSIQANTYFHDLFDSLFESYQIEADEIQLDLSIDNLVLDVDTMIPLGLIVNELVSNAFKHAFTAQNDKHISFSLQKKSNQIHILITDNGSGLDENTFFTSNSFGNKLIRAFQQKLHATIHIYNQNGTTFDIRIPFAKMAA